MSEGEGPPGFTAHAFRDALGHFPTGVTVVTALAGGGKRIGVTVSSFNSVSLEPALVLFSIGRESGYLEPLAAAEAYAVNVLADDQTALSDRFAVVGNGKWDRVETRTGVTGAPLLEPALATFECAPWARHDGGDHVIFVGRVVTFEAAGRGRPLVFYRGRYHRIDRG